MVKLTTVINHGKSYSDNKDLNSNTNRLDFLLWVS